MIAGNSLTGSLNDRKSRMTILIDDDPSSAHNSNLQILSFLNETFEWKRFHSIILMDDTEAGE